MDLLLPSDRRLIANRNDILGNRYRVLDSCSSGSFSSTYICRDQETQKTVVVKAYRRGTYYTQSGERELQVLQVLNRLDTDSLFIQCHGSFHHRGHLCLVLEQYGKSLLEAWEIRGFGTFNSFAVASIVYRVAQGLQVLHKYGIVHTDVKLDNILLPMGFDYERGLDIVHSDAPSGCSSGSEDFTVEAGIPSRPSIDVRLIDFGSMADSGHWHKHLVTTREYRAPEVLMGVRWGPECDVWSLGCLLIELALGRIEFDACDDLVHLFQIQHMIGTLPKWMVEECPKEKLCKAFTGGLLRPDAIADEEARKAALEKPPLLDMLSSDDVLADLAMRMLEPDPFERYKIEDVLEHPFFNACK